MYVRDQGNWTPQLGRRMLNASLRMIRLSGDYNFPTAYIREFVGLAQMWAYRANVSLDSYAYNRISRCKHQLENEIARRA